MVREDTESKRIDPDAKASERLGDADRPQYVNLVGKSQIAGLTLEASPAAGDVVPIEDVVTGLLQRTTVSVLTGGGGAHDLLDGSTIQDSVAQAVTRGSLVYGNATPKWDELTIGVSGTFLKSDGSDPAWSPIGLTDLSDVGAKSGSGTTVIMGGSPYITTPIIEDASLNEILKFASVASAVNEVTITNAATTNSPSVAATGGDANIDLTLTPQGTGSVVLAGELDVGAHAINSSSGDVVLECGGTEVMRCETANNTVLSGIGASENANWKLHFGADDYCLGVFRAAYADNARQGGLVFQKSRGTLALPVAVNAGDRVGTQAYSAYTGAAWVTLASIRCYMQSINTMRMEFLTDSADLAMTIEADGDLTLERAFSTIGFEGDPTNYRIGSSAVIGLYHNCPTGLGHRFDVAGTQELHVAATVMTFGTTNGYIDWGTANTVKLLDGVGPTERFAWNSTGIGFHGATPVARAAGLTAALDTITHSAPGTPDYTIADLAAGGYGFTTSDEAQTILSVIKNLQTRVNELEAALDATTGVGLLT